VTWIPGDTGGALTWTASDTWTGAQTHTRQLTGFTDTNGNTWAVKTTSYASNYLTLNLAVFTPSVSGSSTTLKWDQQATGFSFTVTANDATFPTSYINGVLSMSTGGGFFAAGTDLTKYTRTITGNPPTPIWTNTYSVVSGTSNIYSSVSSGLTGGSATGSFSLSYYNGTTTVPYGPSVAFSINWNSVSQNAPTITRYNSTSTTGSKISFLDWFTKATYVLSQSGLNNAANGQFTLGTCQNGTATPSSGQGDSTLTQNFTSTINAGNITTTPVSVAYYTTFTRPVGIGTDTSYQASTSSTAYYPFGSSPTVTTYFYFYSFWLFLGVNGTTVPSSTNIVTVGTPYSWAGGVTQLGDQVAKTLSLLQVAPSGTQTFWFGCLSSLSQPSTFSIRTSLSTNPPATPSPIYGFTDSNGGPVGGAAITVNLGPGNIQYNLYGFNVAVNPTFVSSA